MIKPRELIKELDLNCTFDPGRITFDERLGFMDVTPTALAEMGLRRLLGVAVPITPEGTFNNSDIVTPLTNFADLPRTHQTISQQGKGVGPRLFNTLAAVAGMPERPDTVGVYTFDIDPDRLLDSRSTQGNKVARIMRHAGRMVRAQLHGVKSEVEAIHAAYGAADAVVLELPPHGLVRQHERGVQNLITPEFIVIRSPDAVMRRVGKADPAWTS